MKTTTYLSGGVIIKSDRPEPSRNQYAIDILEDARRAIPVTQWLLDNVAYRAYMMLVHAANHLELQGRI